MGWRVLVVDDEVRYGELLRRVLERDGFAATAVDNGEEATELLLAGKVDLLVTDLQMPGLSGADLAELAQPGEVQEGCHTAVVRADFPARAQVVRAGYDPAPTSSRRRGRRLTNNCRSRSLRRSGGRQECVRGAGRFSTAGSV